MRNGRRRDQDWSGRVVRAEIRRCVHGDDARSLASRADIDASDPAVGDDAARKGGMQHARQLHIVDKKRAAGQQSRVFVADDASANLRFGSHVQMSGSIGCALHGIDDVLVSGASTQIRR